MRSFLVAFLIPLTALAYETDQFTTPPHELADSGPALSRFVTRRLRAAIAEINAERRKLADEELRVQDELRELRRNHPGHARPAGPRSLPDAYDRMWRLERRLERARERRLEIEPGPGFVAELHGSLGTLMTWQDQLDGVFGAEPTVLDFGEERPSLPLSYLPPKTGNIYSFAAFHRLIPSSYFIFSSTYRVYGVDLGWDKLGHFFNQGHEYFALYQEALSRGASPEAALAETVASGVRSENGLFGRVSDGVYSNADLAANFAGFWFYRSLFEPIEIFGVRHEPLLSVSPEGDVAFRESAPSAEALLRPFVTSHLNEALNPCVYESLQRRVIRGEIRERCATVLGYYGLESRDRARELTDSLRDWSGMDYGNSDEARLRIDALCF